MKKRPISLISFSPVSTETNCHGTCPFEHDCEHCRYYLAHRNARIEWSRHANGDEE